MENHIQQDSVESFLVSLMTFITVVSVIVIQAI